LLHICTGGGPTVSSASTETGTGGITQGAVVPVEDSACSSPTLHIWVNANMSFSSIKESMRSFVDSPPNQRWVLWLEVGSDRKVVLSCLPTVAGSEAASRQV
jgi:hypothetical protein